MDKKKFFRFLDKELQDKPYKEVEEMLNKKLHKWLAEYYEIFFFNLRYCYNCKQYTSKEDNEVSIVKVQYIDYAKDSECIIEKTVKRTVCPLCGDVFEEVLKKEIVEWL